MELREYAERIVFATSLEDKLRPAATLTDACPGPAPDAPPEPGRPAGLRFKPVGAARDAFPGMDRLDRPAERGRVLHFFANHELLAVELMALVLLRFPEAPAAFRRGVLRTLRDEQEHVRLYLARMAACGVAFGELPVSGYFWRAMAPMADPMDFVTGLSLTFEQANLDFALAFGAGFARAGDADTAAVLERIHRDEISHVAHGVKWLRRWKDPAESDWDAFSRRLRPPLSPRRARGTAMNVEARRAAGLDEAFIARLEVFSRSRGRTPVVHLFNPHAEARIARGPGFAPAGRAARLAVDLANLPQFVCAEDDVVLVPARPRDAFLATVKRAGFPVPEFVVESDPGAMTALASRKLAGLRPWAWEPDAVRRLAPLAGAVTRHARPARAPFDGRVAALYSKAWSAAFLGRLLDAWSEETGSWSHEFLCPSTVVGVAVDKPEAVFEAIRRIRAGGHHRVVVKRAFGLAGGDALRLWEPEPLPGQIRWIRTALAEGAVLVVEPWLERVADFSVQYEMTSAGLRLVGHAGLLNDHRGQYLASTAAPDHARRPPPSVVAALAGVRDAGRAVAEVLGRVAAALEPELRAAGFAGPLGVDAFVYRDPAGACRLKPVVEINPRFTMGRLTLELMRHVAPGGHGLFRILGRPALERSGAADFAGLAGAWSAAHPPVLAGEPVARLLRGGLCLNDPAAATDWLAVFRADRAVCRIED